MKVNLPQLGKVDVRVEYVYDENLRPVETYIDLVKEGRVLLTGRSKCNPQDQVVRNLGRKYALLSMFNKDLDKRLLTRYDRTELFRTVCPKFFKRNENEDRNARTQKRE